MIITCGNSVGDDPTLPSRFCVSRKGARIDAARPAASAHDVRCCAVPAHTVLRFALVAVAAQESFHGISWI